MGDHGDSARLQSEFRLAAVLSEDDGCEPVEDRTSLIVRRNIGENEPLRLHDLAIHPPARIFDAGGGAHDDTPGAADPRVQLADRVCEAPDPTTAPCAWDLSMP